jgi:hypothetical protein
VWARSAKRALLRAFGFRDASMPCMYVCSLMSCCSLEASRCSLPRGALRAQTGLNPAVGGALRAHGTLLGRGALRAQGMC